MKCDFTCTWQDGPSEIRLPSHRRTWAHLKIAVDDRVFTVNAPLSGEDEDAGARDFIAVSVFPLAEFIAANWWPLLHEPQEKEKLLAEAGAFKRRHWINRHTDGFAYPTLGFFGADTSVRLIARPSHIESANIEFPVSSGSAHAPGDGVERNDLETVLTDFLVETAERLPANDDKTWLQDMIARLHESRADPDEALYCRCAGLLGADPYEPGDELDAAIRQTIALLGPELALEMFATAEAAGVASRARWLQDQARGAIRKSREVAGQAHDLKDRLRAEMPRTEKPWERGYLLARRLRALRGLAPDAPLPTVDAVTQAFFAAPASVVESLKDLEARSGARGLASEDGEGFGIAIAPPGGRTVPQFQLAATFADFLISGDDALYLSTVASTDRQKSNRAFAAEFLAPIDGIKENWSPKKTPESNFAAIAERFGVSRFTVRYQVQNQAGELLP
jgi:hypothetical protein